MKGEARLRVDCQVEFHLTPACDLIFPYGWITSINKRRWKYFARETKFSWREKENIFIQLIDRDGKFKFIFSLCDKFMPGVKENYSFLLRLII